MCFHGKKPTPGWRRPVAAETLPLDHNIAEFRSRRVNMQEFAVGYGRRSCAGLQVVQVSLYIVAWQGGSVGQCSHRRRCALLNATVGYLR